MIVIPAIDLRGGRVVRLLRGRLREETVYGDDPEAVAARFVAEGATWLHVVDLDAALADRENRDAVRRLVESAGASVQVGGGLRTTEAVEDALASGAARVILSTEAVADPDFLETLVTQFGDRVAVALDTDGRDVLVRGWTERAGRLGEVLARLDAAGAPRFLVTAVDRDGTLEGPDLALYRRIRSLTRRPVVASGGVATLEHLLALATTGVESVVVGRALYEGTLSLRDALQALEVSA